MQSLRWIDGVSMNLREVVGGSLLFSTGFGGVATVGWSLVMKHVRVAVLHSHRPLYSGFVLVGCWRSFILLFFKLKIYKTREPS